MLQISAIVILTGAMVGGSQKPAFVQIETIAPLTIRTCTRPSGVGRKTSSRFYAAVHRRYANEIMKILLFPLLLFLSSCSYLSYELEYLKQRNEAKKTDDYLPWQQAKYEVEKKCLEVGGIYQGHSRVVSVYFNNETTLTTISPEIDQILHVILSCRGSYEGVEILME